MCLCFHPAPGAWRCRCVLLCPALLSSRGSNSGPHICTAETSWFYPESPLLPMYLLPVTLQGCSDETIRHSRTDITSTQGCCCIFIGMQRAAASGWPLRAVTSYNGWFGRRSVKELEIPKYGLLSESPLQNDLSSVTQLPVTCNSFLPLCGEGRSDPLHSTC